MGKDGGPMTAKAVAKRIKAKGLGRLRWYCQMCEKQCRDENGFKNHTASQSHQRQLALFSENVPENLKKFSEDFRREFLAVLRQRYGSTLVFANAVYQEYIKDKEHLHMNATQWTTLTEFVTDLGRNGYCRVVEKEDGFWISLIDRTVSDKDRLARQMDAERRREERSADLHLQRRIESAMSTAASAKTMERTENKFQEQKGPLSLQLNRHTRAAQPSHASRRNVFASLSKSAHPYTGSASASASDSKNPSKRRRSRWDDDTSTPVIAEIMRSELASKDRDDQHQQNKGGHTIEQTHCPPKDEGAHEENPADDGPWLKEGIVVKVINKELADGAYYGAKGKVVDVLDEYGARLKLLDGGAMLELDQDDLETTIPKPGGLVMILRGSLKGEKATVKSVNVDSFSVTIVLPGAGTKDMEYEHVSRLAA